MEGVGMEGLQTESEVLKKIEEKMQLTIT